jgi:hypothetical protein
MSGGTGGRAGGHEGKDESRAKPGTAGSVEYIGSITYFSGWR